MKRLLLSFAFILAYTCSIFSQQVTFIKNSSDTLPDGNIELIFDIEIEAHWYLYSTQNIGGPLPASLKLEPSESYEVVDKLFDAIPTIKKYDAAFRLDVECYENNAKFKQIIKPLSNKPFIVKGILSYQTCNGEECILNEDDVTLSIGSVSQEELAAANSAAPVEDNTSNSSQTDNNSDSFWGFLLIAFLAGLGSVVTPCVFPMIPMTVGFLIGGGSSKRAGIMKGIIFTLSVTLIYTLLGLVVALFESTSTTDILGTHWIPNLIFALLFLTFAISFLGAFEITLPSGLANKADKQADRGGYIAAFFVALAMVIVSFSCTGPFVGSILAASVSGGLALKPIIGMAVFGISFSLPFLIFSFFPGIMKKLPKSGGWLNMVKVVFAFILLAFAIKYFYNVDTYFGWGIISRLGFLSIWITLSIILGLYFLGIIRTNHDSPSQGIGWGRMVAGIISIAFAIYMFPGLFGAPLKTISGMLPPSDGSTIVLSSGESSPSGNETAQEYASLKSYPSIDKAVEQGRIEGKPIFLYFKSHTCSVCKMMESTVLNDPYILSTLQNNYIIANLYIDDKTPDTEFKTLGKRLRNYQLEHFNSVSQPLYVIIDSRENILSGPVASSTLEEFAEFINIEYDE